MPDFNLYGDPLVNAVKGFEGYTSRPQWDYKQWSSGYGTVGRPGETVNREEAERRLRGELDKAAQFVDQAAPGLPQGVRDAMISLTFNAGGSWANSGLGAKLRAGDYAGARDNFLQYNKAGGQTNDGLVNRRNAEVSWFGQEGATAPTGAAPSGNGPTRMNDGYQGILSGLAPQQRQGGILGALTNPDALPYIAMIAKGFNPYSSVDPQQMMEAQQRDLLRRHEMAMRQQDRQDTNRFRQLDSDRDERRLKLSENEADRKQRMLEAVTETDKRVYNDMGGGSPSQEQIYDYMRRYPNMSKDTRDFLQSRLGAIENQKLREAGDKTIPGEVAGRLALADSYLSNAPAIRQNIEKGDLTGPVDWATGKAGFGEAGVTRRDIQSGVDALRRMLTGAGMPVAEADEYVERYMPTYKDTSKSMLSKHDRLVDELTRMRSNIVRGRGPGLEAPGSKQRDESSVLQEARDAISKGAPKDKVMERLRSMGVKGDL